MIALSNAAEWRVIQCEVVQDRARAQAVVAALVEAHGFAGVLSMLSAHASDRPPLRRPVGRPSTVKSPEEVAIIREIKDPHARRMVARTVYRYRHEGRDVADALERFVRESKIAARMSLEDRDQVRRLLRLVQASTPGSTVGALEDEDDALDDAQDGQDAELAARVGQAVLEAVKGARSGPAKASPKVARSSRVA